MKTKKIKNLPPFLFPFFWEVQPRNIQLAKRKKYVLERLLEYGNDQAISWVKKIFSRRDIQSVVNKSRNLSPKTKNFWRLTLKGDVSR